MPDEVEIGGRTLIAVRVPAGLAGVYAVDGRYLIRDGPRDRQLSLTEVHQLMMQRGVTRFEAYSPEDATLEDIDWDRVRQYTDRLAYLSETDPQEALKQRACVAAYDGTLRPTYAGLLLFGCLPTQWVPGAEILAVRYVGSEASDDFARQEISGPLADQIRMAEAFLRANSWEEVLLEGLTREARPMYPTDVLREVIVNAVAHRDYAIQSESIRVSVFGNRIEVYSPGALPGHVTVQNIVDERFSRNPVIVQVLADMGFVERLGYGIDRMLRLMREAGQPAPHFEETVAGFRVTLYARRPLRTPASSRRAQLDLNPRQELALQHVIEHQSITNREYQKLCPDVSAETVRRDLADLVHKDVILRIGNKRATYYILKDAGLAEA